MDPLASVAELRLWLQDPDLDEAYALLMLTVASGRVRAACGQDFTAVTDDTVTLDGLDEEWLALPQRPVGDVTAVEVNGVALDASTWTVSGNRLYRRGGWARAYYSALAPPLVTVTYDHGYAVIPDDVKAATLAAAAELVANPQGLTAEDIDDYKWRREGGDAGAPAASMLEDVARRYNPRARTVRLGR